MAKTDKAQRTQRKQPFLARLLRERKGNVYAITVASIIPLMGMMGGAVDLSRAYLVKSRMQQACDAAVLAGRKAMSGNTLTAANKTEAYRFFRYNFPDKTMGSKSMVEGDETAPYFVSAKANSKGQLGMVAKTSVPTTILQLINIKKIDVDVQCMGEEYYVNTDVMLVLDTTGSMNCAITDPTTCGQQTEKSNSKMRDLRNAVKGLYAALRPAQEALETKNLRMRIGFVMYASTVNVGKIVYGLNPSYINNPAVAYRSSAGAYVDAGLKPASWFTGTGSSDWNGCIVERQTANNLNSSSSAPPLLAYDLDIETIPNSPITRWTPHIPSAYNRASITSASGTWSRYDATAATNDGYNTCPQPAQALRSWASLSAFNSYVDTIQTGRGGTYHDIGMIWGTRMIANKGIFAAQNPDSFNNVKVRRTIVLVTDGTMAPNADIYGAYGVERYEGRVYPAAGGTSSSIVAEYKARHEKRFNLMCSKAKSMNIDIWVIAILDSSTPITSSLESCATSGQALKVSDTTALNNAFARVADKVGNLRIGQ